MSRLQNLLQRPITRPPLITITGESGVGKTTLAALFPSPVMILTEDGTEAIPEASRPYAFPLVKTSAECLQHIEVLRHDKHRFETLIIDSVTQLGAMIDGEIVAADRNKPRSINQALGGYGNGPAAAAAVHKDIVLKCRDLSRTRNMAIIFVGHSVLETFEPPDADPYTRYTLRLDKRSTQPYIDLVDAVVFVRVKTRYVTKEDSKKVRASTTSERVLIMYPTGAHVAKNRYGVEQPVSWADKTANPLLDLIPYYQK